MKEKQGLSAVTIIVIVVFAIILITTFIYIANYFHISFHSNNQGNSQQDQVKDVYPIDAENIFDELPKIYKPISAPYNDEDLLQIVMNKINMASVQLDEYEPDYSETNVNNVLHQLFGPDVNINKTNLTDISAPYYFSSAQNKYVEDLTSTQNIFQRQILKVAKQTNAQYYIEAYSINGQITSTSATGDQVQIKDKNGNTITINNYAWGDGSEIVNSYKDRLPVIKYTLAKNNNTNYIVKTEFVQ